MTQAPESEFFTEDGKAVADRVYVEKKWGRRGFSIERLCNELGELHTQLDSLKASNEAQINEIKVAIARMMPDRAHLLPKQGAATPSNKSPSPRDIFAEALETELTRQRQPGGLLANDAVAWRPLTRTDMVRATSAAHRAAMDQLRTAPGATRPAVKESLTVLPSPAGLLVEPEITQRELCRIWNDSPDPDEESGDAMARLYSAGFHAGMKWQAELLKQPVTEQVSAPAPASSLVERVAQTLEQEVSNG